MAALSDLTSLLGLIQGVQGGKQTTTTGGGSQTTQTNLSDKAVQAQIERILAGPGGVRDIGGAARRSGLYDSTNSCINFWPSEPRVGSDGYVKGVLANGLAAGSVALNTGVALSSAAIGEDVRIGVGPAVIAVPGAVAGQRLWGINSRTTGGVYAGNGNLYPSDPGTVGGAVSIPVAVGVAAGFAIIGNYVSR